MNSSAAEEARQGTPIAATLRTQIIGVTPLLQHNPAAMIRPDGKPRTKQIPTPKEEAERSCYRNESGELVMPAAAVRASIIAGGKFKRIPPYSAPTVIAGYLLMGTQEYFRLFDADEKPITDYEIDSRRAVVQRQGVIRSRAMINIPWSINASFEINEEVGMTVEALTEMAGIAGRMVGLGDYRIQKGGNFGAYKLGEVELIGE